MTVVVSCILPAECQPTLGPEVNASGNPKAVYSETAAAINPGDPRVLIVGANHIGGDGTMPVFASSDRGATFARTTITNVVNGITYHSAADPSVAFDLSGNAYYSFMVAATTLYDPYHPVVAVLKAGESQWAGPYLVSGVTTDDDKPMLAVDAVAGSPYLGRVYVAWDRNYVDGSQAILLAHSSDGQSWSAPARVDDPATSSGSVIYAMPVAGPGGAIYVVWNDYGDSAGGSLRFDKSLDGGATFGTDVTVAALRLNLQPDPADPYSIYAIPAQPSRGIAACPSLGVDTSQGPRRGYIYVCYGDRALNRPSDDVDVFVRRSSDGGTTWTAPVRVNDDTTSTSQFFPWMSVDPVDGSLNVSFYDCRNDATNRKADVYFARSTDGGATFSPNLRVTSVSSDQSTSAGDPMGNDYGDYAGITAYAGLVVPAWTDSRGGYNQAYTRTIVFPTVYSVADVVRAMAIAAGLRSVSPTDAARLDVVSSTAGPSVSLVDAVRIARAVAGLSPLQ